MVLLFLADGFEEIEALTPTDILRRADIDVKTVSVGKERGQLVTGSHGIGVCPDMTAEDAKKAGIKPDAVILPGGMPGAKNLDADPTVDTFVKDAYSAGKLVASICAAPMIPGKRGMLDGKRATCFPGFEEYLTGAVVTGGRVETDGNMITACGMGASTEFALAIVKALKGEGAARKMHDAILAK